MAVVTNSEAPVQVYFDGWKKMLKATRKIRQGEVIATLPQRTRFTADKYSIEIAEGVHLDCEYHFVGATNHSCDPNAAIRNMNLVAWKCIAAGEEITIDYKRTETKLAAPFDCECGAKNCRGRIE